MLDENKELLIKKLEEGLEDSSIINKHYSLLEIYRILIDEGIIPNGRYQEFVTNAIEDCMGI